MTYSEPRHALRLLAALCLVVSFAGTATACPFCDGTAEAGNPVRDAIFGADFWPNLLALAALPAAFLTAAGFVYHGLPAGRPGGGR